MTLVAVDPRDLETRICAAPLCPRDAEADGRCRQHHVACGSDLAALAERAVTEHRAAGVALNQSLQHAIVCGEALLEAHTLIKTLPDVQWGEWLAANIGISNRYAYGYMRLAVHRDALPPEAFEPFVDGRGHRREPSVSRALGMAARLPAVADKAVHWRLPAETRDEIVRLGGEGLTYAEIGRRAGVHHVTVARILDPDMNQRRRAAANRHKRAATAADRAAADAAHQQRLAAALTARPHLAEPYRLSADLVARLAGDPALKHAHRYAKAARNALTTALLEESV